MVRPRQMHQPSDAPSPSVAPFGDLVDSLSIRLRVRDSNLRVRLGALPQPLGLGLGS